MSRKFGRKTPSGRRPRGLAKHHKQAGNSSQAAPHSPATAQSQADASKHQSPPRNAAKPQIAGGSADISPPIAGGLGARSSYNHERREADGQTAIHNKRQEQRAVRQQWVNGPWPLDWDVNDFDKRMKARGALTVEEGILLSVLKGVSGDDPRIQQIAARTGVAMKGQNIALETHDDNSDYRNRALESRGGAAAINVNNNSGGGVVIVIPHNGRDEPPPNSVNGMIYLGGEVGFPTIQMDGEADETDEGEFDE